MDKKSNIDDEIKPDLRHDTMEFSANTDGDDKLDTDNVSLDEEGITSEELDILEDDPQAEAAALDAVEADLLTDEDNMPEEDWLEDIPGGDATDENEETRL